MSFFLTIVNDNPSLTIVNIIVNKKNFKNDRFFKNNRIKKRSQIVLIKTIVIRFLKVQINWVVFKNDRFFLKTKRSFLKTKQKTII